MTKWDIVNLQSKSTSSSHSAIHSGSAPVRLVRFNEKSSIRVSPERSGMGPGVKVLLAKNRYLSAVTLPRKSGIGPVSSFELRSKWKRPPKLSQDSGIGPPIEFLCSARKFISMFCEGKSGKTPERRLLWTSKSSSRGILVGSKK